MRNHNLKRNSNEINLLNNFDFTLFGPSGRERRHCIALHDISFIGIDLRVFVSKTNPHQYQ